VRVEVRSGEDAASRLRADVDTAAHAAARAFWAERHGRSLGQPAASALDDGIRTMALAHALRRGLHAISMPSWAGHDAKILAPHVPAGLIFVPSRDGISHSPAEFTSPAQIAAGVQVLMDTLMAIDAASPAA
jgi:acetylornithine deacetylase/succinyl-diaminopimelate desuccinylase-like protein